MSDAGETKPVLAAVLIATIVVLTQSCWAVGYRPDGQGRGRGDDVGVERKCAPGNTLQPLQPDRQSPTVTGTDVNWMIFNEKTDPNKSGGLKDYKPNRDERGDNKVSPRIYSTYSPIADSGMRTKSCNSEPRYYWVRRDDDGRDSCDSYVRLNGDNYSVGYRPMSIIVRAHPKCVVPSKYHSPTYSNGYYCYPCISYAARCRYGYWVFEYHRDFCRRSIFFHYGYYPYILLTRVYYVDYPLITYYFGDVYSGNHNETARDVALNDVRNAWLNGRVDLFEKHVREQDYIQVLLDGGYDHSITGSDLLSMVTDAITNIQTRGFVWERVSRRSSSYFVAYACHRIVDPDGGERTVYVSYGFVNYGGTYYIVETGASSAAL